MGKLNWPVIGFFLLMAFVIGISIVDALEPALCEPGKLALAAKQLDVVVFRCWEFWLNRYQALIGSLIAVAVAFAALLPVYRQLRFANKQTSIMVAQTLRARIEEYSKQREGTKQNIGETREILDFIFNFDFRDGAIGSNVQELETHLHGFVRITMREWEIMASEINGTSAEFRKISDKSADNVSDSIKQLISDLYKLMNYIDRPNIKLRKRIRIGVEKLIEDCNQHLIELERLEISISAEIVLAWQSVRIFEKNALTLT